MLKETAHYTLANASLVEDGDDTAKTPTATTANSAAALTQPRDEYLLEQLAKTKSDNLQRQIEIMALQNDIYRLNAKQKEFNEEKITLLMQIDQLEQEKIRSQNEVEQIHSQKTQQEQSFAALKAEIDTLEFKIQAGHEEKMAVQNELEKIIHVAKQKEQFFVKKINELGRFEEKTKSLLKVISEKETLIKRYTTEVAHLNTKIEAYSTNELRKDQIIDRFRHERTKNEVSMANVKKDLHGLITELEKVETIKAGLEKTVEKAQIEISNLRQEINQMRLSLGQIREQNARLETDNKNLSKNLEKTELELRLLKDNHSSASDESKRAGLKATLEQERLMSVRNQLEANLKLSLVKVEALEKKLASTTKQAETLESERGKLVNELTQKSFDFSDLQIKHNRVLAEHADLKEKMTFEIEKQRNTMLNRESELTQIFRTAEADYKIAQESILMLQRQMGETETSKNELAKTSAQQAHEIAVLKKELDEKRVNYNKFTAFFETEREKTNKVLSQLMQEIKQSIALHPLKDYLQATENELSRKELEVKKLPYDAPNRRSIERQLEQLFEQRNTTRDLIEATEKHLLAKDTKVHHLMSYIDSLQVPKKL